MTSNVYLAELNSFLYNTDEDVLSVKETDAIVELHENFTVLCFRGTEAAKLFPKNFSWSGISNFRDVLKCIRFWRYRTRQGWLCHKGFAKGAEVWFDKYKHRIPKDIPLVITGHSLGAAIAVQAVPLFKAHGYYVASVVVFGEPASMYKRTQDLYTRLKVRTVSYINGNDFIKWTPPWGRPSTERTKLFPKKGIGFKSHGVQQYIQVLRELEAQ